MFSTLFCKCSLNPAASRICLCVPLQRPSVSVSMEIISSLVLGWEGIVLGFQIDESTSSSNYFVIDFQPVSCL